MSKQDCQIAYEVVVSFWKSHLGKKPKTLKIVFFGGGVGGVGKKSSPLICAFLGFTIVCNSAKATCLLKTWFSSYQRAKMLLYQSVSSYMCFSLIVLWSSEWRKNVTWFILKKVCYGGPALPFYSLFPSKGRGW